MLTTDMQNLTSAQLIAQLFEAEALMEQEPGLTDAYRTQMRKRDDIRNELYWGRGIAESDYRA